MEYVCFENNGILEPDFIRSFGVSVKNDESCIGFFGTGLKYALAILLRQGAKITIYSGDNIMRFGLRDVVLKGKAFKFVTMNDEQLPFTTELGKTWEPWMAYRELYSNAKDEGGEVSLITELPDKSDGKTFVVVAGGGIVALHNQRTEIFTDGREPIAAGVYAGGGSFFSKGVCVWKYEDVPTLYSYSDEGGNCDLTEDRQVKNIWQVHQTAAQAIARLTDKAMLEQIVLADLGVFESHVDFDYCQVSPSAEFMEVARTHIDDCKNEYLKRYVDRHTPAAPLEEFEPNQYQMKIFNEAVAAVKMAGFMVDEYPVKFVISLRDGALGMAKGGNIYISMDCFLVGGLEMLKSTLIEEWVHLKYKHKDCERNMQNYLFTQIVRLVDAVNEQNKMRYAA